MTVTRNEHSGSTWIVVDDIELEDLRKAVWDEQMMLVALSRTHLDHRERLVQEIMERWRPMAMSLSAGIVEPILRKGIDKNVEEDVR